MSKKMDQLIYKGHIAFQITYPTESKENFQKSSRHVFDALTVDNRRR